MHHFNKGDVDSLLARRLERKKRLNDMVYDLSTEDDAAAYGKDDADGKLNIFFNRFNARAAIIGEARDEVTATLRDVWHRHTCNSGKCMANAGPADNSSKRQEQPGDDAAREGADEEKNRSGDELSNLQSFLACGPTSRAHTKINMRRSSAFSETSSFSETGAPMFACAAYPQSVETSILAKIDFVERSISRVVSPRDADRLEKLERKLAALDVILSEEEDSDGDVCYTFSLNNTFESIGDAPAVEETCNVRQEKDAGEVDNDQSTIPAIYEIAVERAKTSSNGTEIVEFYTPNVGFAIECKFSETPGSICNEHENDTVDEKVIKDEIVEENADVINAMLTFDQGQISEIKREQHSKKLAFLSISKLRKKIGR